jgi:hypothetical protein
VAVASDEVRPTWAGATELALAAAKISKADRNEITMSTEFCAVNRHYRRAKSRSKSWFRA